MSCYVCLIWNGRDCDIDKAFLSKEKAYAYADEQNKVSDLFYYIAECELISDDLFVIIE